MEHTMQDAIDRLNLICEAAAAVPCRHTIALSTSTGASRGSKGRNDTVTAGTVIRTQSGYAICDSSQKVRLADEGDWVIRMALRRPVTSEEVARVTDAMVRDWSDATDHIARLDADDYRNQPARDTLAAVRRDYLARLAKPAV